MKRSLDEVDLQSYNAGPSPLETAGKPVALRKGGTEIADENSFSLDGSWDYLTMEETPEEDSWKDGFTGEVPSEVHKALFEAGWIPDPVVGRNQDIAREYSFKTWWLRKKFRFSPVPGQCYRLSFEGVADRCTVWLNGQELGSHRGMFGGPDFDVTETLRQDNELIVKLEPIPCRQKDEIDNPLWRDSVVVNNVYGWHYFSMPQLGIYRPVRIVRVPAAEVERPFVFTRDPERGRAGMTVGVTASAETGAEIEITVSPRNFEGETYHCTESVALVKGCQTLRYEFTIPDARAWWPNDLGEPNLYRVSVACRAGGSVSAASCLFGLRTVHMDPLPEGPDEKTYNWSFVINGRKVFIKGTNWCTIDALLDLSRERYDRFLSLARAQHLQMFRAWGAGMPETDDFYELCSEYGIMVLQEWPTAWNSHKVQPFDILEDTIRRATKRIRSFPALVMYGAGNESSDPFGEAIDMMGRISVELDGTRPFHRGEPWGGSRHDYYGYWGDGHVDHHLNATSRFWGEYGYASVPSYETFLRYMPKESLYLSPEENPDFIKHTPTFGRQDDISHLVQSARYFIPRGADWKTFITASQMIHALGVRRVIDRSRAMDPECAGVVYYKMNDNNPAASWSCVDYYGVPKIAHYVFQDSYEPLRACVLFERTAYHTIPARLPVYLLDDAGALPESGWQVRIKAYGGNLRCIKETVFDRFPEKRNGRLLGQFILDQQQTDTTPLLVVCDLQIGDALISRSFYFSNFEQERGCMFNLPRASLKISTGQGTVTMQNVGKVPAVGVMLCVPGKDSKTVYSDNFLWIEPGEEKTVKVSGAGPEEVVPEGLNLL